MIIYLVYILVMAASFVMVYLGSLQGQSQFYMCVFSAAIVWYCLYLDYQKRSREKAEKQMEEDLKKGKAVSSSKKKNATKDISKYAHQSSKSNRSKK